MFRLIFISRLAEVKRCNYILLELYSYYVMYLCSADRYEIYWCIDNNCLCNIVLLKKLILITFSTNISQLINPIDANNYVVRYVKPYFVNISSSTATRHTNTKLHPRNCDGSEYYANDSSKLNVNSRSMLAARSSPCASLTRGEILVTGEHRSEVGCDRRK